MQVQIWASSQAIQYLVIIQRLIYETTGEILNNKETIDLICAQHAHLVNMVANKIAANEQPAQTANTTGRPNDHKQQQRGHFVPTFGAN